METIVKNCVVHGGLTKEQCYVCGKYFMCKQCTIDKRKSAYLKDPEKFRDKAKKARVKHKDKYGVYNKQYRTEHAEEIKQKASQRYKENPEKVIAKVKARYIEKHEEIRAKARTRWWENRDKYIAKNKEFREKNKDALSKKQNEYYNSLRLNAINHYSNGTMICKFCGNNVVHQLCLDHIDGGGTKHRKLNHGVRGRSVFSWVKQNGYPPIFQILCYNCNQIKSLPTSNSTTLTVMRSRKLKELIMRHYSPELECVQCGFDDIRALTIDHINGQGRQHLKSIGLKGGVTFYRWIRNNNFPDMFQILCCNCNCGKNSLRAKPLLTVESGAA